MAKYCQHGRGLGYDCLPCQHQLVAALRAQLRQAQKAAEEYENRWIKEQQLSEGLLSMRDAAIERGKLACHFVRIKDADVWWFVVKLRQETERAEELERQIEALRGKMEVAK